MIISALIFSALAALLIWWAGRRDLGRDPRLTLSALLLLLIFPLLGLLPKAYALPAAQATATVIPWSAIWLTGCLCLLCKIFLNAVQLWRLKKSATLIDHITTPHHHRVSMLMTAKTQSPCVAGIWNPQLFVPEIWSSWDSSRQQAILQHELAHIDRRDPLWRTLAAVTCAIYWFNPLVWWLSRRLVIQSELACDRAVITSGTTAKSYATLLCDLSEESYAPRGAAAIFSPSFLRQRVNHILSPIKPSQPWHIALLIFITAGVALGISTIRQSPAPDFSYPAWDVEIRLQANPFPDNH